jgi:hypothetical protein
MGCQSHGTLCQMNGEARRKIRRDELQMLFGKDIAFLAAA